MFQVKGWSGTNEYLLFLFKECLSEDPVLKHRRQNVGSTIRERESENCPIIGRKADLFFKIKRRNKV